MYYLIGLTLRTANSLCGKWSRAKEGVSETKPAFEQLTECLEASLVREWTAQERVAMEKRGEHLRIYEVTLERGTRSLYSSVGDGSFMCFSTDAGGNSSQVVGN
jgi:hypothetical protein